MELPQIHQRREEAALVGERRRRIGDARRQRRRRRAKQRLGGRREQPHRLLRPPPPLGITELRLAREQPALRRQRQHIDHAPPRRHRRAGPVAEPGRVADAAPERMAHRSVDLLRAGKADLELLRVHVDVDGAARHGHVHHRERIAAALERLAIAHHHRVQEAPVAHEAPIDEQVGAARAVGAVGRRSEVRLDGDAALFAARLVQLRRRPAAAERHARALQARGVRRQIVRLPSVGAQAKVHRWKRQRQPQDRLRHVRRLGRLAAHELEPRRHVGEKIAHLDPRAHRPAHLAPLPGQAALDHQLVRAVAVGRLAGAGGQRQLGDRCDRGQRLAAKSHRRQREQIVDRRQLRGGVALEREVRLLRRHPGAVVADGDEPETAALDLDLDASRAGVERVLHQLLDHRRRPLDHLAGGDLIGQLRRQHADARGHEKCLSRKIE